MHVDDDIRIPEHPWTQPAPQAASALEVVPDTGLSADQAQRRMEHYGPNELSAGRKIPAWRKILALLTDRLILVLITAAVISAVVSREWETPVVILAVIILNTVLNYVQEQRAENSLEALRSTSVSVATVRRGGQMGRLGSFYTQVARSGPNSQGRFRCRKCTCSVSFSTVRLITR